MSILIKGMEMPQNCICCDLSHEDGWCPAKQTFTDRYTFETCPLVPVPPHGDLIDRDKLEKDIDKYVGGEESRSRFHHWVQVQHTVIPKSEEA